MTVEEYADQLGAENYDPRHPLSSRAGIAVLLAHVEWQREEARTRRLARRRERYAERKAEAGR